MIDKVAQVERPGKNLGVPHLFTRAHRDCCKTGDEENLEVGIDLVGLARDLNAINLGHYDIGDQKVIAAFVHSVERRQPVGHRRHLMTAALKCAGQEFPHRLVVFRKQNSCHDLANPGFEEFGFFTFTRPPQGGAQRNRMTNPFPKREHVHAPRTAKGDRRTGFR
jgi:hypothetical protein